MAEITTTTEQWHQRFDRGELIASRELPDGTLLVEGFAARPGILEYRNADGSTHRERVTADTLRKSAAGLARASVTLEHPGEDVTPDNVARFGVGDVDGEVVIQDDGFVRVKMAVRRRDAIGAIKGRKKQELSPGYSVSLDETPGVDPELGRYDATQVERRYNHLAIVGVARGGPQVRLRADSAVATTSISSTAGISPAQPPRGAGMNSRLISLLAMLGISQRVDSEDAALDAAIDKLKERQEAASKADRELAAAVQERDTLRARADAAERERDTLRADETKRRDAAERQSLEQIATVLQVDATKHATLGDLKRAVARAHLGTDLRADASDAYVDAMVDLAVQSQKSQGRQAGAQAWSESETRADARTAEPDHEAASWKRWSGPTHNSN
jgi:hypothetical protein